MSGTRLSWFSRVFDRPLGGVHGPRWRVADAESLRNEDPRSFSIPRREQRCSRRVGDTVKVLLELVREDPSQPFAGERPWLEITFADETSYRGIVESDLVLFPELGGKEIAFKPENIIALTLPDAYVLPFGKICRVSGAVLVEDAWPTHLVRVAPEHELDSGWRVFHLGGSLADARESLDCGALIERFQVLDSVLDEPGSESWRWEAAEYEYRRLWESAQRRAE